MNGFKFDNSTHSVGGAGGSWNIENKNHGAIYFSVPLGLPMLNNDGGNATLIDSLLTPTNKFHSDGFYLEPWNSNGSRGLLAGGAWYNGAYGGRWASLWSDAPSYYGNSFGLRCGLSLEY